MFTGLEKCKRNKGYVVTKRNKTEIEIRSSAAEYLTFIASTGGGSVDAIYADENVWLTQKTLGVLYNVKTHTINYHLKKIFQDCELDEISVIRKFRITAKDGKTYNTKHYNLSAIIAVGYKVNSERAVQFRKWATDIIKEYTVKAYVMDDERIKQGGSVLNEQYFEEQLQRIREIRLSERLFYQKVTDIYATSLDYDSSAKVTKRFFAMVQNKLHWAIHFHTPDELILERADSKKKHMGLKKWKDYPNGKIQKFDINIATNYLTEDELTAMSRIVNAYLDLAENMAKRKIPMTMEDWEKRMNLFLQVADRDILKHSGCITNEISNRHALTEFEKYRIMQDYLYESDFDRLLNIVQEAEQIQETLNSNSKDENKE